MSTPTWNFVVQGSDGSSCGGVFGSRRMAAIPLLGTPRADELSAIARGGALLHGRIEDAAAIDSALDEIFPIIHARTGATKLMLKPCPNGCTQPGMLTVETVDDRGLRKIVVVLMLNNDENTVVILEPPNFGVMAFQTQN